MLTLYGSGASQPSRAVWWTCLIKGLSFELREVTMDQLGSGGPLSELNPTGQIPIIQDDEFTLYEMPAILAYLCRKHGWTDLHPEDLQTRALVEQYLHFHHNRTRNLMSELMAPHVIVAFIDLIDDRNVAKAELIKRALHPDKLTRGQDAARQIFQLIEKCFFRGTHFLCTQNPTIADIACYQEVSQLYFAKLFNFNEFPRLKAWLGEMSNLPHHDTAHRYNILLGDIATQPNTIERFLAANTAAVEALSIAGVEVKGFSSL